MTLLSVPEAARQAQRSNRVINGWIRSGKLPATRSATDGPWRIDSQDLRQVIQALPPRTAPTASPNAASKTFRAKIDSIVAAARAGELPQDEAIELVLST